MTSIAEINRQSFIRRGRSLEHLTIGWNSAEMLIALAAGLMAGSISLIGFGLDSLIEVASGAALLWRLHHDSQHALREELERRTLRFVGWCFLALAAYVVYESTTSLIAREEPESSITGILLAIVSLAVMPLLARAKRKVARQIGSASLNADAMQTQICAYLSAILLVGLLLNALLGWWWADPIAALLMTPLIAREGIDALRGKGCACHGTTC